MHSSGQIADLTGVLGPEHGQDRAPVVPAGNAEGSGGLGYSLVNGSNAFVGLKEVCLRVMKLDGCVSPLIDDRCCKMRTSFGKL